MKGMFSGLHLSDFFKVASKYTYSLMNVFCDAYPYHANTFRWLHHLGACFMPWCLRPKQYPHVHVTLLPHLLCSFLICCCRCQLAIRAFLTGPVLATANERYCMRTYLFQYLIPLLLKFF